MAKRNTPWHKQYATQYRCQKLAKLAKLIGAHKATAYGYLGALREHALLDAPDGDLSGLDDEFLEEDVIGVMPKHRGFISAAVETKWLDGEPGQRSLHNWARYYGSKKEADKKARQRACPEDVPGLSRDSPGTVPPDLQMSRDRNADFSSKPTIDGACPGTVPGLSPSRIEESRERTKEDQARAASAALTNRKSGADLSAFRPQAGMSTSDPRARSSEPPSEGNIPATPERACARPDSKSDTSPGDNSCTGAPSEQPPAPTESPEPGPPCAPQDAPTITLAACRQVYLQHRKPVRVARKEPPSAATQEGD